MLAILLALGSCTGGDDVPAAEEYGSAKELIADLRSNDEDWSCSTNLRGNIIAPKEIGTAQCRLRGETGTATVHVWESGSRLPELDKTEEGPFTWWVTGPNWFVATGEPELASAISDAIGGEVISSRPSVEG